VIAQVIQYEKTSRVLGPTQNELNTIRDLGEEITPSNTPSRTQLRRKRNYIMREPFPSDETLANIHMLHQPTGFLKKCVTSPALKITLASTYGEQLLRKYGSIVFLDTTFSLIEQGYKLTVPIFFFKHNLLLTGGP
jgi:hypothetical protein